MCTIQGFMTAHVYFVKQVSNVAARVIGVCVDHVLETAGDFSLFVASVELIRVKATSFVTSLTTFVIVNIKL
jgi:hypothetical protein